jgi:hypothetical protein
MTIEIKVGETEEGTQASVKLVARKTIDGMIVIMDHDDVDIVIQPDKKKIIIFPKSSLHDNVYACQDRLFTFLAQKGIIKRETVQAGDVYGSLQAEYPDAVNGADATQLVVFTISKFIEEEKPHIEMEKYVENEFEERMTKPDEEESTELGEVPQAARKGTIDPARVKRYLAGLGPY